MNKAAQTLGRMAAGAPKNYGPDEITRRRAQMTELNRQRALAGKVKGSSHDRRKAKRRAMK